MANATLDKSLSFEDWASIFHSKAKSVSDNPWGWCVGSLAPDIEKNGCCQICGQDTKEYSHREGSDRRAIKLHLKKPIHRGLYLINVGMIGDTKWVKVGSSANMLERLYQHTKNPKHEFCEVLHCMKRSDGPWQNTNGVEYLIVGLLIREFGGEKMEEEYFPYSEPLVERCRNLFDNPSLLIPDLIDSL